jgi:hypothetical protein
LSDHDDETRRPADYGATTPEAGRPTEYGSGTPEAGGTTEGSTGASPETGDPAGHGTSTPETGRSTGDGMRLTDRGKVIDDTLRLWTSRERERATEAMYLEPKSAQEHEECAAWRELRRAAAARLFRNREAALGYPTP